MRALVSRLWADEAGATAIEYALVGGIMLCIVLAVAGTGGALTGIYERVRTIGIVLR